ncbi:MAG: hypothetical protein COY80_03020 [Candidatus Pacebacteria bacterium CG_4_10_14_0_8_um_filter_42_14]|nr:MAG: hypothetical protein COY80_03020 [Candidatus Pacebacteria bacterium CG_4_10_14_0_8_um_filter_42_14]
MKTAVITGASKGIGHALAEALAQTGEWQLTLIARSEEELKKFVEEHGDAHTYIVADFSKEADVDRVIEMVKNQSDQLDLLANVAGIGVYKALEEVERQAWHDSLAVNVTAPFLLTQGFMPLLEKAENSLVLSVGSGAGCLPMPGRSVYCTTKFALRGVMLSLSEEMAGKSPDISLITLGSTMTGFGPLSLEEKETQELQGKTYLTINTVVKKLMEIISAPKRESEYTLYPSAYEVQYSTT